MTVVDTSAMHDSASRDSGRRAHRAHYFAEVDVLRSGTPKPLKLWGENLSEGGIFLQTNQPWIIGEKLALRIPVEDERVVIRQAEVAWVRPFEPINVDGRMAGIGVRFLSIDPPYRAAIRQVTSGAERAEAPAPRAAPVPAHVTSDDAPAVRPLPVLSPLSLPPIAEPEFTLKGWSFAKAPRALDDDAERATPIDGGPSEIGAAANDESRGWRIAGPSTASTDARASVEASRAPAPADTSVPEDGPPPAALAIDEDDVASLAGADDAMRAPSGFTLDFDDSRPNDWTLNGRRSSTPSGIGHSTLEDHVPFTRVVSANEGGRETPHESQDDDSDDRATFVPRSTSTRGAASFIGGAFVVALGAVFGVFLGLEDAPARSSRATAQVVAEPRSVFEAERGLHALLDGDEGVPPPAPASSAESTASSSPSPTVSATQVAAVVAPPEAAKAAPVVSPASVTPIVSSTSPSTSAALPPETDALLPRKPTPVASAETLTSSTTEATRTETSRAPEMKVERGRVTIPFHATGVKTAFTLAGPPRVVVDLEGAPARAFQEIPIGEKGVTKLRFGRPKPDTVRVVVELDPGASPREPSTILSNGALAIAWR